VIAVTMNGRGQPQYRSAHATRSQRDRRFFRLSGKIGIGRLVFHCERAFALNEQGPRSNDQRAVRAGDRGSERLNGPPICLGGRRIVVEIVDESGVNDPIRSGCSTAQTFRGPADRHDALARRRREETWRPNRNGRGRALDGLQRLILEQPLNRQNLLLP